MKATIAMLGAAGALAASLLMWVAQPVWPSALAEPVSRVSADALKGHVEALLVAYPARNHTRPDILQEAARHIGKQFADFGARVEFQRYEASGSGYVNVIAHYGPNEPAELVIGAHYDAESNTPGADDNASGVAGVLELARLLGDRPPGIAVDLVAYTLEEPPYFRTESMGSMRHAAELKSRDIHPRLVIVLEMIGHFDDADGSQSYPVPGLGLVYPTRGNFVALVGNATDVTGLRALKATMSAACSLPVWSISAPSWVAGIDFSDHASYWRHGIPAVMVTDTAFYRNASYHRPSDVPDALDYRRMAQVVQGIEAFVRKAAAIQP